MTYGYYYTVQYSTWGHYDTLSVCNLKPLSKSSPVLGTFSISYLSIVQALTHTRLARYACTYSYVTAYSCLGRDVLNISLSYLYVLYNNL